jgi:hypothetical protein
VAKVAENIDESPVNVRHEDLKRTGDSPFRSWCPVCDEGILLVGRIGKWLKRADRCTLCGQLVIYRDVEIAGEPFEPFDSTEFLKVPLRQPLTRWDRMLLMDDEDED